MAHWANGFQTFFLACTTGTHYELVISMQVTRPPIKYLVEQEFKILVSFTLKLSLWRKKETERLLQLESIPAFTVKVIPLHRGLRPLRNSDAGS